MRALLAALLLASHVAVALALPPPEVEVGLAVDAVTDDGVVHLNITAEADADAGPNGEAATVRLQVVVTHEDPILGTVLDAVIPIEVAANATTNLALDDLRPDVDLQVHVVAPDARLPELPELDGLVNGTRLGTVLAAAPELPNVKLPRLDRLVEGRDARARGWHVGDTNDVANLVATTRGHLVASWWDIQLRADGGCCTKTLLAAVSQDGGRRYTDPIEIATEPHAKAHLYGWGAFEDARGRVVFVSTAIVEGPVDVEDVPPALVVALDAREAKVVERGTLDYDASEVIDPAVVQTRHGTLVALRAVRDATGNIPRPQAITVFRLDDGKLEELAVLDPGTTVSGVDASPFRMAVSPLGVVGIVAAHHPAGADAVPWSAVSLDGGKTWTKPRILAKLARAADADGRDEGSTHPPAPTDVVVDELGTVHATFVGRMSADDDAPLRSWYVRSPVAGDERVTEIVPLVGPSAHQDDAAWRAQLATREGRVWIFWTQGRDGGDGPRAYGAESVDTGLTFGRAFRLDVAERSHIDIEDVALLPDGRPVVLGDTWNDLASVPLFDPLRTAAAAVSATEAYAASPDRAGDKPPARVLDPCEGRDRCGFETPRHPDDESGPVVIKGNMSGPPDPPAGPHEKPKFPSEDEDGRVIVEDAGAQTPADASREELDARRPRETNDAPPASVAVGLAVVGLAAALRRRR